MAAAEEAARALKPQLREAAERAERGRVRRTALRERIALRPPQPRAYGLDKELKPKKLDTNKREEMIEVIARVKEWQAEFEEVTGAADRLVEDCEHFQIDPPQLVGLEDVKADIEAYVSSCAVFEEYMGAVQQAQIAFSQHLQQLKARGAQVTTSQLNETRNNLMQNHVLTVLKKYDMTNLLWVAALEKYSDSQVFKAAVERCKKGGAAP